MSEHLWPTSFSTSNTLPSLDLSLIKTIFGWESLSSAERFTYLSNRNRNRIIMDTRLKQDIVQFVYASCLGQSGWNWTWICSVCYISYGSVPNVRSSRIIVLTVWNPVSDCKSEQEIYFGNSWLLLSQKSIISVTKPHIFRFSSNASSSSIMIVMNLSRRLKVRTARGSWVWRTSASSLW